MRCWYNTHQGMKRTNNEDSFIASKHLGVFAVADGMGGLPNGELASSVAIGKLQSIVKNHVGMTRQMFSSCGNRFVVMVMLQGLQETLSAINDAVIFAAAKQNISKMGSTLSVLWIAGPYAFIAHSGDSRIYRYRSGVLSCLTHDHVGVDGMLIGGLGLSDMVWGEVHVHVRQRCDRYLICSDGLTTHLDDKDLAYYLSLPNPKFTISSMIDLANVRGGVDNITAILIEDL